MSSSAKVVCQGSRLLGDVFTGCVCALAKRPSSWVLKPLYIASLRVVFNMGKTRFRGCRSTVHRRAQIVRWTVYSRRSPWKPKCRVTTELSATQALMRWMRHASEQTHLPVHWISKANAIGNSRLNRNRESACRFPSGIHRLTCAPKTNRRSVRCEDHGGRDRFRKGAEVVYRIPWSVSRLHPSGQFVHRWTYRGVGPPETREHLKVALSLRRHETDWIASIPESLVYQLGNNHGAQKGSDGGNG